MKTFEYLIHDREHDDAADLRYYLDGMGEKGWELVVCLTTAVDGRVRYRYIFKKEMTE